MDSKFIPALLIGFGIGFLLYNLGIINFTPWDILWPAFIIWFGFQQLNGIIKRGKAGQDSAGIALWLVVISIGFYFLLPAIGIPAPTLPRRIFWPLVLILIGVLKLLPGGGRMVKFQGDFNDNDNVKSSFIGEINRGPNWVLDDLSVRHGIGSVNLDLTQAMIPDREITLDIAGYIGDATIFLPPGLAFKAECYLSIGEITVLDHNESGTQKYVKLQSPDYETATQKVDIRVHWRIGEINIRQIR